MQLYLKVIALIKPYWRLLLFTVLMTFFYVAFNNFSLWVSVDFISELFQSSATEQITESLSELGEDLGAYHKIKAAVKSLIVREDRFDTLKMICLVIFVAYLLKNITFYSKRTSLNYIELNIVMQLRNKLQAAILRQPLYAFEKKHSGQLTSVVFNDVKSVNDVLSNSFGRLLVTPIEVLTKVALLFLISWKLTLISFALIPISTILIVKIGQSIRRKSRRMFQQISHVMTTFQEAISGIRIVKAFTNEEREEAKFNAENLTFRKYFFRTNRLNFLTSPLNETFGAFVFIVLLWYGGKLVYTGGLLDAEDLSRFMLLLFSMFSPIKDLSGVNNTIQTGMAAAERIFGIIDAPQEPYGTPSSVEMEPFSESIVFENVSLRYDTEGDRVLKNIHIEVKKGESIALVGPSGSGKTSLVHLLPRFYEFQEGAIRIDGVDLRSLTLHSLRRQIGLVTQETILFNDTVRANIAYGMEGASESDIIEAAVAAHAWEFVKKMDEGLDSVIGERGVKLSGGQRQRLSIARAILKNPPILILDEATSALDTESERLVQEAIETLMEYRTVLVIAHRLSTVMHSDRIVVLHHGEIVGEGNHASLLKDCPLYQKLYEMQFQDLSDLDVI